MVTIEKFKLTLAPYGVDLADTYEDISEIGCLIFHRENFSVSLVSSRLALDVYIDIYLLSKEHEYKLKQNLIEIDSDQFKLILDSLKSFSYEIKHDFDLNKPRVDCYDKKGNVFFSFD